MISFLDFSNLICVPFFANYIAIKKKRLERYAKVQLKATFKVQSFYHPVSTFYSFSRKTKILLFERNYLINHQILGYQNHCRTQTGLVPNFCTLHPISPPFYHLKDLQPSNLGEPRPLSSPFLTSFINPKPSSYLNKLQPPIPQ